MYDLILIVTTRRFITHVSRHILWEINYYLVQKYLFFLDFTRVTLVGGVVLCLYDFHNMSRNGLTEGAVKFQLTPHNTAANNMRPNVSPTVLNLKSVILFPFRIICPLGTKASVTCRNAYSNTEYNTSMNNVYDMHIRVRKCRQVTLNEILVAATGIVLS